MENSQKYMKDNGYQTKISFKDGQAHTVKLLKDKEDSIPDGRGGTAKGMKYLVEEGGEKKTIFTSSIGLISKLAVCNTGDVVTIQMKSANNKSFFVVTGQGGEVKAQGDENTIEIGDDDKAPEDPDF